MNLRKSHHKYLVILQINQVEKWDVPKYKLSGRRNDPNVVPFWYHYHKLFGIIIINYFDIQIW